MRLAWSSRSNQVTPRSRPNASTCIITGARDNERENTRTYYLLPVTALLFATRTRWRRADGTLTGLGNSRRRGRVCGVRRGSILRSIRCGRDSRRRGRRRHLACEITTAAAPARCPRELEMSGEHITWLHLIRGVLAQFESYLQHSTYYLARLSARPAH